MSSRPVHVVASVLSNEPVGAYRRLVLAAPGIAEPARPGQFVACAIGADSCALLLRRAFSLHRADPAAGTIEIVVAARAPGTDWVCTRQPGETINVVGPLGQPFRLPTPATASVLVGGGYGAAPLHWWADQLRDNGHRADVVVGAADTRRLFGHDIGLDESPGGFTRVVTEDGSTGTRGRVTDVLGGVIDASSAGLVYACGPMGMLRAVHQVATTHGAATQLAVEESMACGIGVCMTCVLPVVGSDGLTRMTRSCVDGPVFDGDRLRWDAIEIAPGRTSSRVPDDCLGAPVATGTGH